MGTLNTSSHLMLLKPEITTGRMGHLAHMQTLLNCNIYITLGCIEIEALTRLQIPLAGVLG